jgi:hypothetical protein
MKLAEQYLKMCEAREPKGKNYYFTEVRVGSQSLYSKLLAMDKKLLGTKDYMGIAYFWGQAYKHELRDCTIDARVAIHDAWLDAGLDLDGESAAHESILKKYL